MLNSLLATLVIVLVGIFAAGSVEIAEERTERRRVQSTFGQNTEGLTNNLFGVCL